MRYTKVIIAAISAIALVAIIIWVSNEHKVKIGNDSGTVLEKPVEEQTEPPKEEETAEIGDTDEDGSEAAGDNDTGETEKKLFELFLAAKDFYDATSGNTVITQQNGLLYNGAANLFITPEYLVKREYVPKDYELQDASVLYVSSVDMSSVAAGFTEQDSPFSLYVSMPVDDGYLIQSAEEGATKVTKEQYDNLLSNYTVEMGERRRITASSPEYPEINELLKENQQRSDDFYIRYGMRNDKYAVIIASPKDSYSSVKMYALLFDGANWSIKVPNLESVSGSKGIVVNVCRDFDLQLMPDYDLNSNLPYLNSDEGTLTETLVSHGYMENGDALVEYYSMNDYFMFAKYTDGRLFIGVKDENDVWVLSEVESAEKARLTFLQYDEKAADYVIIWE